MDNAQALARLAELRKQLTDNRPIEERAKTNIPFFDWNISFSNVFSQGGFDIVIGNPPYFKYEGSHKGEIDALRKTSYLKIAFGGQLNAYRLFLALAMNVMSRKNGIISYIFQNSFMADLHAADLRKEVIKKNRPITIDSFPERDSKKKRVFESVKMSVCILLMQTSDEATPFAVNFWDDRDKSSGTHIKFDRNEIKAIDPEAYTIPRIEPRQKNLVIKLKQFDTLPLKCYVGELDMTFCKKYFTQIPTNPKILKGASIQRYYITEQMSQGEIEYLDESAYFAENSGKKTQHHDLERVAMQGITGANDKTRLVMSIVPAGYYLANSCNYLLPDNDYPAHYLLGLLNSTLMNWFFRRFSTNSNVNGYEVEQFPVVRTNASQRQPIADLVDTILAKKRENPQADTSAEEMAIDNLVFDLYGLDESEREIIRNS